MRPFLKKLIGFCAIQAVILSALVFRSRSDNANEYLAACLDKHARAESIKGPRILVVGGSNVAFGVDSPELERRLGQPVVNLGLHAGVGLEFMLREAADVAREGDTVILSPEYEQFLGDEASPAIVMRIVEHRPESGDYLTPKIVAPFLDQGLPFLHKIVRRGLRPRFRFKPADLAKEANNPYFRKCFNIQGDVVAHHTMTPTFEANQSPKTEGEAGASKPAGASVIDPDLRLIGQAIDRLNRFIAESNQRGIRVHFGHPPRAEGSMAKIEMVAKAIDEAVRESLTAPVLTQMDDLILSDSHFFDTCYHPAFSGKEIRTRLLADGLEREKGLKNSSSWKSMADNVSVPDHKVKKTAERDGTLLR